MRVGIVGGTGFVGGYLTEALLNAGYDVSLLVRPGSETKVRESQRVRMVAGDLQSPDSLGDLVADCAAVIYNVGILREFPRRGITYETTHYDGAVRTVDAARRAGVSRFLLMSANGVKQPGTPYQETKYRAEQYAQGSGLDVTVVRPSVIFGDPRGTMEFATQLCRDMVRPPLPAIAFFSGTSPAKGAVVMSPVHIEDVADAFVAALQDDETIAKTLILGGPETLTWQEMLRRIGAAVGRRKVILPMPLSVMRAGAALFDWLPFFPVTRDQLTMLAEGNTAAPDALESLLGRRARGFTPKTPGYLGA